MKKNFKTTLIAVITALAIFLSPLAASDASAANITSSQLSTEAKKYIGIKYRSAGTTTKGFDCSGYVQFVYNKLGVKLPRTSRSMYATGKSVKKNALSPGDLVFFNTSGSGVSHVGIYIGKGNFIHSSSSKGVSIAKINDPYYWGKRYVGAKRVTAVAVGK
jgi:cell wall-associated NlpC family hydrolase